MFARAFVRLLVLGMRCGHYGVVALVYVLRVCADRVLSLCGFVHVLFVRGCVCFRVSLGPFASRG